MQMNVQLLDMHDEIENNFPNAKSRRQILLAHTPTHGKNGNDPSINIRLQSTSMLARDKIPKMRTSNKMDEIQIKRFCSSVRTEEA